MEMAEDTEQVSSATPQSELLRVLGELALRSGVLEPVNPDDPEAVLSMTLELTEILESSIDALVRLERLPEHGGEVDDEYAFPELEESTWVGVRPAASSAPRLADICFAATLELNRALRQLIQARKPLERLAAAETARRKLHRALLATFEHGGQLSGSERVALAYLNRRFGVELDSAIALRRLFASFRRSLRRPENDGGEAVLMALRYAAGALATLTTSASHGTLRVADRILLGEQRERLLAWSRAGRPIHAGLQLLEDIFTCADLLRDINRRQELRSHDSELIRELLHPAAQASPDWLIRVDRLAGLDDALDGLLARAKTAPEQDLMMDLILRLSCLV